MPGILFLFIFIAFMGDRKNFFSGKQFKTIKKIIIGIFVLNVLSSFSMPFFLLSFGLIPLMIPIGVIWFILSVVRKSKKDNEEGYRGSFNQKNDETGAFYSSKIKTATVQRTSTLVKSASKRRKIIEKFNKKYELYLTESQIQRMVDASYYSPEWEKEIEDMDKEYASVYEWFQGNTAWLRAYLKTFKVQSVSSDFEQQKQICFSEFDQVFGGIDFSQAYSHEDAIREINDKFFTGFDDISFMIAYRFLEANGRKYNLGHREVLRNESETDRLAKKYDQMPSH